MADATLSFVSWVRRGLATANHAIEGSNAGPLSNAIIEITFGPSLDTFETATLDLINPGDITGLDSHVICRVWPKPNELDAEFTPFALLEFDQADLPWRYTAAVNRGAPATLDDQLRPWFSLLVFEAGEASLSPASPEQKLAVLTVNDLSALPDPAELWAWAHTQFEGASLDENQAAQKISGQPGLFSARLISPRLLKPSTAYIACLVPTFERGRLIGLGTAPSNAVDALAGWNTADSPFRLPAYYSWQFTTGTIGDFEQAARLIKPFVLPETIGRRDMDVATAGFNLPPASPSSLSPNSLPVEGALMSVAAFHNPPDWPVNDRTAFINALKPVLNAPAAATEPVLVPPLYGQWYAAQNKLTEAAPAGTNPPWFQQLNSDPRSRVGSALGTAVIQREQQALLAGGWTQVDEIKTINDLLRVSQLARGLLVRVYARHFLTLTRQHFYQLTASLHARVVCGSGTVCQHTDSSPIVPGFLSSQWLRWTSPRGPIGRLQGRPGQAPFSPDLIGQLNDCKRPAPEPPVPGGLHTPGVDIPGGVPCERIDDLVALGGDVLVRWGLVIAWVVRQLSVSKSGDCWWIALRALRYAIGLIQIAISGSDVKRRCKWNAGTLTAADVAAAPFMSTLFGSLTLPNPLPLPPIPSGTVDSADAAAIRAALSQMLQAIATPADIPCPPPMSLDTCRTSITTQLQPTTTVGQRVKQRLSLDASVEWNPLDPLEPLFAPPEYERPMYLPLSQISRDWILPGLNGIERDSIGLVVTNQRFVEAYMVGLNHEMTRELLWQEFPTDQRGTYFRQFWDIAGHILEDGSTLPADQLRDIKPIRKWGKGTDLGGNSPRPPPLSNPSAPFLVLVLRAQLIQKYPNVIVYAQKLDAVTQQLTGTQQHPVFYALLEPDVAFYGFMLTEADIRSDPSWYFVLQEQPGDPKFADEASDRASSKNTSVGAAGLGQTSSVVADRTFLQPFRLGVQAISLLPET
ncbi:MAG TPA: hypothetical protein VFK05_24625 [Polyangiaceae bacterium]|nr:hypothetical protein [Polyangiaceae bacterium]